MPTLKNVSPLGALDVTLIGRSVEAGEEFEVTAEQAGHAPQEAVGDPANKNYKPADPGVGLLGQAEHFELVTSKKKDD